MVGRLGRAELAATNIVMAINTLSFMPMIGLSIAVSTLVGQAIGAGRPADGVTAASSTLHITLAYMGLVGLCFLLLPEYLLAPFMDGQASPAARAELLRLGVLLLRFVAVYTLFDSMVIIYMGALKGAGDIYFVMWTLGLAALGILIVPFWVGLEVLGLGLHFLWGCVVLYVAVLGLAFRWRFKRGAWQRMRVIETTPMAAEER